MLAVSYILFVVTLGQMPQLTALASYPDAASCDAARTAVTEALAGGGDAQPLQCVSIESLADLAARNNFQQ